ncbi:hypothetical protein JHK86_022184 [Glycine max]|nr:hypothetical protein JHK86_022184 [Glycine max]
MHYVLSEQEEQTTLLAKKHKISRPSSSMTSVIDEKEPTTLVAKKHKVSCPSGSMAAIFEDLEETASSLVKLHQHPNTMTMKNPNGRESSYVEMFMLTHKPEKEETSKIILKEEVASHPEALKQSPTRDDVFFQVLGKDGHGYVRTYGKGFVPSNLWGTKSQVGNQKVLDEVKINFQVELQSLQRKNAKGNGSKTKRASESHGSRTFRQFQKYLTNQYSPVNESMHVKLLEVHHFLGRKSRNLFKDDNYTYYVR